MEIISYLSIDEIKGLSNEWFIRKNTGEGFANGVARFGLNHGGNSIVKRTQAGVVSRWVTSWDILMLRPYEHHLDRMSAKCSIYSHERWFHYGVNSVVKCAQGGVVLGWVTSWEVPVLHPYEHHPDPMSAKCSKIGRAHV